LDKEGWRSRLSFPYLQLCRGTVILPWSKHDDKWKADIAISIISGGVEVDPKLISGEPKERIRLITHEQNAILVITWPDPLSHTFFIFDSFGRQLTTSLHKWSLGEYPPTPFCQSIIGPKLNVSTGGIDIQIEKGNKLTTSISFMLPGLDNGEPVLMVYEI